MAYRYVNVSFVKPRRKECLRGLWQRRVVVRVIENEVAMIDAVRARYSTEVGGMSGSHVVVGAGGRSV